MKPKEFDELLRRKFEQNDFEYNSRNWDKLAEQLEGRAKKRSIALWWWMPLAGGIAASVALAMGFVATWRGDTGNAGVGAFAQNFRYEQKQPIQEAQLALQYSDQQPASISHKRKSTTKFKEVAVKEETFGINLDNAIGFRNTTSSKKIILSSPIDDKLAKEKQQMNQVAAKEGLNTFKPDNRQGVQKAPKVSIILLGGVNQGSQNSGYVAGATFRRMVNDKVYVESDVAYESSNNIQPNWVAGPVVNPGISARTAVGRTTNILGGKPDNNTPTPADPSVATSESYNVSYAQVSPSVGVRIIKRMSLAAGPDFQQALSNNRPAPATDLTHDNIAVMPLFDLGLMGKTEYSVTKKVKAAVSYRKGINNLLTPMDKFIDRNYLQVQIKYTIFNK